MNSKKDASTTVTFRLPTSLKAEIGRVADETDRSLSNALLWLIRRGIDAYDETGLLGPTGKRAGLGNIKPLGTGMANVERETRPAKRRA